MTHNRKSFKMFKSMARRLMASVLCFIMTLSSASYCVVYAQEASITEEDPFLCGLEEHIHTDECYALQKTLACTQNEAGDETNTSEGLSASEAENGLEALLDANTEGVPADESEGDSQKHIHTESCYETKETLICEIPEHIHTEECLPEDMREAISNNVLSEIADNTVALAASDYALSFTNTAIGCSEKSSDVFTFHASCSGATVLNDTVTVTGDGDGVFNLSFPSAGTYTVNIICTTGRDGDRLGDERTLEVTLSVSGTSGNYTVTESSRIFKLSGIQTGTQRSFVAKYNTGFTWSPEVKARAQKIMDEMTLEEKVGQLFILHYPNDGSGSIADAKTRIETYHPGAYLVFAAMFTGNTPDGVRSKVEAAQNASKADSGIPLFFSVDEEGGNVVRISDKSQYNHAKFASQKVMASKGAEAIKTDAVDKAEFLKGLGMNVNHAPVADVADTGYMASRERTYGGDPLKVAECVAASVAGHESVDNIGTSIKHFPGYGATSSNTHNGFAINDLSRGDFDYGDLLPFYAGIAAGSKSVMVTHNIINCMDSENPASLSASVVNVLREEMNFDGVIMTDDLNMQAIIDAVGQGNAALACLQAGVDMPMCADPEKQVPKVLAAVNDGTLPMSRVEESCLRILCWKIDMGLIPLDDDPNPSPDPDPGPGPVEPDPEAEYTSLSGDVQTGTFDDMWALAVANGGTVKMLQDVSTAGDKAVSSKDVTLNLNYHKLHFTSGTNGFLVSGGMTLTITDAVQPTESVEQNTQSDELAAYNAVRRELVYYTRQDDGVTRNKHTVDMDSCGMITGDNTGIMLEVTNGKLSIDGGVLSHKVRAVESINLTSNVININGGAIVNCGVAQGGTTVNGSGVGIYGGGTLNISGGYIAGNKATTRGGGIIIDNGNLNISGGVFAVNKTNANGGAIYLNGKAAPATITGGVFSGNAAGNGSHGGAIISVSGAVTVNKADGSILQFVENTAGYGGAIDCYKASWVAGDGIVDITGGQFFGNTVSRAGGAIGCGTENLTIKTTSISGASFIDNTANTDGGAVFLNCSGASTVSGDTLMEANHAGSSGGGLYLSGVTAVSISDVNIVGNTADSAGGGIYHGGKSLSIGGHVRVNTNKVNNESNNLYLASGKTLNLASMLDGSSLIRVYTEVLPTEAAAVDVVATGNTQTMTNCLAMVKSDRVGYTTVMPGSKIVLAVGSGSHEGTEITFNGILFQYYSVVNRPSDEGDSARRLEVIDTTGGNLPVNGTYPAVRYLYLNADGSVKMDSSLKEIYSPEDVSKDNLRPLGEMNKFADEADYYQLDEIWVAPSGQYAASIDADDWAVYPWSENLKLTTSASEISETSIYIDTGSVVRFVCSTVSGSATTSAMFYDYDVGDGYIYDTAANAFSQNEASRLATTAQAARELAMQKVFMNTVKQGINSDINYDDLSKATLAFGNANMQTGRDGAAVDGYPINKANRVGSHFKLCSFGIVKGIDAEGHLIYNSNISAPKLFDDGDAAGKTVIDGHSLGFVRDGDAYTFDSVSGTDMTGLSIFGHPGIYDGVQNQACIWTNNFWPLDYMGTFGADGHDMVFGATGTAFNYRKVVNKDSGTEANLPTSDDGTDHNAYFGMQFALEFTLEPDYIGPMEYYFFGDDDMWIFLDDTLICDVGGVHQSAGSYANLWDYVEKGTSGTHTLRFFFTERGASGSTCWMRFNIPHMKDITHDVINFPGSLRIEKAVEGIETTQDFDFTVTLNLVDESGTALADEFTYIGSKEGVITSGGTVSLANGEYIIIQNLPEGTQYTIEEAEYKGFTVTSTNETGTVGSGTTTASFINTYSQPAGTLRISKQVIAGDWPHEIADDTKFEFVVTLQDAEGRDLTGAYQCMDKNGNVIGTVTSGGSVFVGDGEYIDIVGIPEYAKYTVTEKDTDGYLLDSKTNDKGVIIYNETVTAGFINREIKFRPLMPASGGCGTMNFYFGGFALLAAAALSNGIRKRKANH